MSLQRSLNRILQFELDLPPALESLCAEFKEQAYKHNLPLLPIMEPTGQFIPSSTTLKNPAFPVITCRPTGKRGWVATDWPFREIHDAIEYRMYGYSLLVVDEAGKAVTTEAVVGNNQPPTTFSLRAIFDCPELPYAQAGSQPGTAHRMLVYAGDGIGEADSPPSAASWQQLRATRHKLVIKQWARQAEHWGGIRPFMDQVEAGMLNTLRTHIGI
jgi:hypothetical protein